MTPVWTGKPELISWVMESDSEKVFVVHNLEESPVTVDVPEELSEEIFNLIFATYPDTKVEGKQLTISALGTGVFRLADFEK